MVNTPITKQEVQNILKTILNSTDKNVILKGTNNEIVSNISDATLVSATIKAIIEKPKGATGKALDSVLIKYVDKKLKAFGNKASLHNFTDKSGAYITIKDIKVRTKKEEVKA